MKLPLFAVMLLAVGVVSAEPLYITVPAEGWTLKLDAPAMTSMRGTSDGRRFQYQASSVETGITLSLHTETEGSGSNDECRDTYWKKTLASPTTKSDINLTGSANALLVTHLTELVYQGKAQKTANGHAYFVKNGLCMDLHVSHWPYQSGSEKRVEVVLRSLLVVP
ncbi:MAG: hypothetical protein V4627_08685 [Pseudomonadota bacterium]